MLIYGLDNGSVANRPQSSLGPGCLFLPRLKSAVVNVLLLPLSDSLSHFSSSPALFPSPALCAAMQSEGVWD